MIGLVFGLGALFALSYLGNRSLVQLLPSNTYPLLLLPGIVLHELSHAAAAVFTGTPIQGIKLFSASGGYVLHEKPRLPVVGQFAISFAPLVVGISLAIYLLSYLPITAPTLSVASIGSWALLTLKTAAAWRIVDWAVFYIFISIILTLTPSRQDIYASTSGLIALVIGAYIMQLNSWLYISVATIGLIWYINIWLAIITLVGWPLALITRRYR